MTKKLLALALLSTLATPPSRRATTTASPRWKRRRALRAEIQAMKGNASAAAVPASAPPPPRPKPRSTRWPQPPTTPGRHRHGERRRPRRQQRRQQRQCLQPAISLILNGIYGTTR